MSLWWIGFLMLAIPPLYLLRYADRHFWQGVGIVLLIVAYLVSAWWLMMLGYD